MTRKTPSDLAWAKKKDFEEKKNVEEVPFTLDAKAVAEALVPNFLPQQQRSPQDDKLIHYMFIAILVLSFSSVLCALISLFSIIYITKNKK